MTVVGDGQLHLVADGGRVQDHAGPRMTDRVVDEVRQGAGEVGARRAGGELAAGEARGRADGNAGVGVPSGHVRDELADVELGSPACRGGVVGPREQEQVVHESGQPVHVGEELSR